MVSGGRKVDVGGGDMYALNLRVSFLPVKMSHFDHAIVSGVRNCGTALERVIQCNAFMVRPK